MLTSTNARVFENPATLSAAAHFLDVLLDGSNMILGPESIAVMPTFRTLMTRYEVQGNDVPDLFLAACAVAVGATLISFDRGFSRFVEVTWWNPLDEPVARL